MLLQISVFVLPKFMKFLPCASLGIPKSLTAGVSHHQMIIAYFSIGLSFFCLIKDVKDLSTVGSERYSSSDV